MGNNQGGHRRERTNDGTPRNRAWSGGNAGHQHMSTDDGCPVQVSFVKIAKSDVSSSTPSIQFHDSNEYPVVFKWKGGSQAKNVYVTGSWDQWKRKIPLVKSTQEFTTIINLSPGEHEYKFLVDGRWCVDDNIKKKANSLGSENNVIEIDQADFEVFDALDRDLASSHAGEALKSGRDSTTAHVSHDTPNDRELEKLRTFSQEIPDRHEFEQAHNPPVLPPHLLQVILNKDTPVQCDPNVLPEPNHVMLNHLYALSIKDGVMVLSATHRYRKKYVTTLLYKPI
uniref:5'-AMP-activated protein kinase subunit beta-1 n=1 Tax=Steinernema glaseri TaxID=37863 RepID=A0A1I8A6E4_9BILA